MHAKGITGLLERIIGRSQTGSYKDIRDGLKKLKPRIWERERACTPFLGGIELLLRI